MGQVVWKSYAHAIQGANILCQAAEPLLLGIETELAVCVNYPAKEHRMVRKDRFLDEQILAQDLTVELQMSRAYTRKPIGRVDKYMKKEAGGILMKAIDNFKVQ